MISDHMVLLCSKFGLNIYFLGSYLSLKNHLKHRQETDTCGSFHGEWSRKEIREGTLLSLSSESVHGKPESKQVLGKKDDYNFPTVCKLSVA